MLVVNQSDGGSNVSVAHGLARLEILALWLTGVMPIAAMVCCTIFLSNGRFVNQPVHAFVETAGASMALFVAALIICRLSFLSAPGHFVWPALALIAMGVLDACHAMLHTCPGFTWTRVFATFVGGALFAMTWLPERFLPRKHLKTAIVLTVLLSLLAGALMMVFADQLPLAFTHGGDHLPAPRIVNLLGGVFFLFASFRFYQLSLAGRMKENLLFCCHCLLFGLAGFSYVLSNLWDAQWWLFHALRLFAYCVLLVYTAAIFRELHQALQTANDQLEVKVGERTAELITVNTALQDDIRKREEAEDLLAAKNIELARINEELEQFASIAAHDLQEPLRTISNYLDLFHQRFPERMDEKAIKYMNHIKAGTSRMQSLISDLLRYSRVGKAVLIETDAQEIFDLTISGLGNVIEESGALITRDKLPVLVVDRSQLSQVFQNLLANAIKFRGTESPRIHVSVVQLDGQWQFSVRDNGIGLESQYSQQIFQLFRRLHPRDEYPGTGLGLAICKKIVERNQGRLWVSSEPGRGSTFFFTLPVIGSREQ